MGAAGLIAVITVLPTLGGGFEEVTKTTVDAAQTDVSVVMEWIEANKVTTWSTAGSLLLAFLVVMFGKPDTSF